MKKLKDERIIKETNSIIAPFYFIICIFSLSVILIKYFVFSPSIYYYSLEIIALSVSMVYLFIRSFMSHIPLIGAKDLCIKELQNSYRTHSFMICFGAYIIGEFVCMFVFNMKIEIVSLYILIWIIPSIIISYKTKKKGLLIWGTKKREKIGLKSFKIRVAIGSLFYGIAMEWMFDWKNKNFSPIDLLWVLGMALLWGIPFYFIMKHLIKKSEKISNIELKKAENKQQLN